MTELDVKTLENRNIKVGQNDFNAIAAMKSLYPELLGANNDEYGFENNGLTYADMINSSSRISDFIQRRTDNAGKLPDGQNGGLNRQPKLLRRKSRVNESFRLA